MADGWLQGENNNGKWDAIALFREIFNKFQISCDFLEIKLEIDEHFTEKRQFFAFTSKIYRIGQVFVIRKRLDLKSIRVSQIEPFLTEQFQEIIRSLLSKACRINSLPLRPPHDSKFPQVGDYWQKKIDKYDQVLVKRTLGDEILFLPTNTINTLGKTETGKWFETTEYESLFVNEFLRDYEKAEEVYY